MTRLIAICSVMLLASACGKSNNPPPPAPDAGSDAGTGDGGPDFADGGCFANPDPNSNYEIINACTDAGYVDKVPVTPLLLPDGGLPPLL